MLHTSNQTNPGAVTTADTRGDSFARVSAGDLKRLNEQLLDLVLGHQRNGGCDMSGRELQQAFEAKYQRRIEMSSVSSAVNRLVAAERLQRSEKSRPCLVTEREILPVFAPAKQAGLV